MRLGVLIGLACWPAPLAAQQVSVGGGYAFSDYREQAAFLHFRGFGPAGSVSVERGRLGVHVDGWHLNFDPTGDAAAGLESFTLDEIDLRVGVRMVNTLALEAGYIRQEVSPSRAAQSFSGATFGVRGWYSLAPGASVALRTAYVAGSDFTGGGSAPFGISLGLSAAYGPGSGRFSVTGDYRFERIDRHTDQSGSRLSVPIQSSVARLGLAVKF
jgi:hypothetical protein